MDLKRPRLYVKSKWEAVLVFGQKTVVAKAKMVVTKDSKKGVDRHLLDETHNDLNMDCLGLMCKRKTSQGLVIGF